MFLAAALTSLFGGPLAAQEALETLRARASANPTDYPQSFAYARAAIDARDYEAAITAYERILFYNPALSRAKFELGNLYFRLSSYSMAVRYFEEALADPALESDTRARAETSRKRFTADAFAAPKVCGKA